ncbi:branched-chain amino acid transporter permease [Stomatohabitans albus]
MASNSYIALAVIICGLITWALRAIPFALLRPLEQSAFLAYLGDRMPLGIMTILAVYTFKATPLTISGLTIAGIAGAVTLGLHICRRNFTLSVFGGTAVYTLLQSLLALG